MVEIVSFLISVRAVRFDFFRKFLAFDVCFNHKYELQPAHGVFVNLAWLNWTYNETVIEIKGS